MACPFFQPTSRWDDSEWLTPPRVPLGELCRGVCRASNGLFEPGPDLLRSFCNRGYARNQCQHFPAEAAADALRFSLAREHDGVLTIQYIYEHEYGPLAHGNIECSEESPELSWNTGDPAARAQAQMFVECYRRRTAQPPTPCTCT